VIELITLVETVNHAVDRVKDEGIQTIGWCKVRKNGGKRSRILIASRKKNPWV
jgi:hypothetical protein